MIRVRQIISSNLKKDLLKLIPKTQKDLKKKIKEIKCYYPTTLINLLPNTYSDFGLISEYMLRLSSADIHGEALKSVVFSQCQINLGDNTLNLMSTRRYIHNLMETRILLEKIHEEFTYDDSISYEYVEGHPDILSSTGIFEVKTSCKADTDWNDYLLQIFSYAALAISNNMPQSHIYIVLPLQASLWKFELREWFNHQQYIRLLCSYSLPENMAFGRRVWV